MPPLLCRLLPMLLFFAATACIEPSKSTASAEPPPDLFAYAVDADGPYAAGYRTVELSYLDPLDKERTIEVSIWYPAAAAEGPAPVYSKLFADKDVHTDAPLAPPARRSGYPVLLHSHGFRGYPGNSADLTRHFATHGWVVLAPAHRDNTLLQSVEPLPLEHFYHRPLDMREALNGVAGDKFFGDQLDLERVMVSGHSFGTYTVWALAGASYDPERMQAECASSGKLAEQACTPEGLAVFEREMGDARVRAALPMAGGWRAAFFGDDGHRAVRVPMLFMTGTADSVDGQGLYDAIDEGADFRWLSVQGGCHQLFGYGDCEEIGNEEGFRLVNAYAMALARVVVLDDDNAELVGMLDGSRSVSEKALLKKK